MEASPVLRSRKPDESPLVEEVKLLRLRQIEYRLKSCLETVPIGVERRKQVQKISAEARSPKRRLTDIEPKLVLPETVVQSRDVSCSPTRFSVTSGQDDGLLQSKGTLIPSPQKHYERLLLDIDAENRLSRILGRKPTRKEILELRHGEQALRLDTARSAQTRQLVGQTRALRNTKNQLLAELRQTRKQTARLRKLVARKGRAAKSD